MRRKPDDWAAILFTSGSEGVPKGVVLSHRNILTNAAQARARIDFNRMDKVFNILPVFHSFGLTVGADPADRVGRADLPVSVAAALPHRAGTGLRHQRHDHVRHRHVPERVCAIGQSLRFPVDPLHACGRRAGARHTRQIYLEKFGLRILEGYGVTETAPALALNTPMFNKFGTVGRLLPGMEARLEKVEGVDEGGRLFVKGRT